jgi:hypothetical protein
MQLLGEKTVNKKNFKAITLKVFNDGMLYSMLFFFIKSIVQYTKMKPQCFRGWLCPCFQVIKPTLLGRLEGDNPNFWLHFSFLNDGFSKKKTTLNISKLFHLKFLTVLNTETGYIYIHTHTHTHTNQLIYKIFFTRL